MKIYDLWLGGARQAKVHIKTNSITRNHCKWLLDQTQSTDVSPEMFPWSHIKPQSHTHTHTCTRTHVIKHEPTDSENGSAAGWKHPAICACTWPHSTTATICNFRCGCVCMHCTKVQHSTFSLRFLLTKHNSRQIPTPPASLNAKLPISGPPQSPQKVSRNS